MKVIPMETIVRTKRWGNSLGVLLPAHFVKEEHIMPGEELVIEVKKKQNVLKELFGALPSKKSSHKVIKEMRKELESKWFR